jgi:hypothetical protein
MRKIILLNAILLLSSVWASAQYDSDSESRTASRKMMVEGCVEGATGNYTLTDYAGTSYRLTGNPEDLKAYVGETVQVTGVVSAIVHVPGAMSEGSIETLPTLSATSLKRVSAICGDTNNIP